MRALLHRFVDLGILAVSDSASVEDLRNSPAAFANAALCRWLASNGASEIDDWCEYRVDITDAHTDILAFDRNGRTVRPLVIQVSVGGCGYLKVGNSLTRMEALVPGLGRAWYRVLTSALNRRMFLYDLESARANVQGQIEWRDQEVLDDQGEYEILDVEASVHPCLRSLPKHKPMKATAKDLTLLRRFSDSLECGEWIQSALSIHKLCAAGPKGDVLEEISESFNGRSLPCLLLCFTTNDNITGAFDSEAEGWGDSYPAEPNFAVAFDPEERSETSDAIQSLAGFLAINLALSQLAASLNGIRSNSGPA